MKLTCKLFGHRWIYSGLHKRCKWCDERIWFIRDIELLKEVKEVKPKAKKQSKALSKIEVKETPKGSKFEKREFSIIRDHQLATLIRDHFDDEDKPSLKTIADLCDWGHKQHEICVDCDKKYPAPLKISNERDMILYLVHKDVLAEGNWIVLVTVD